MARAEATSDSIWKSLKAVHEYPVIHGISTHLLKYGDISHKPRVTPKLAVVITGNPGAIDFYDEFMKQVHIQSGWPVWGISHAGHSAVPKDAHHQGPDESVFTLEGQIEHKLHFIKECVPEDVEIVLMGHSIGAYVVLEVMNRIEDDRISQAYLLFPTIERMATSPQGKRMTPLLKNARWLFVLLAAFLSLLPLSWQRSLIEWVFTSRSKILAGEVPQCIKAGALHMLNPYCVANAMYMAHIEMEKVVDLDKFTVDRHLPKLRFYYGAKDHWCPDTYYHDMKKLYPDHAHIYLCDKGFRHAFIINSSKPMADIVAQWLLDI